MEITFRPMQSSEYPKFIEYFVADYSIELAQAYGLSATRAKSQAQNEIADDLPFGVETADQVLLCIENEPGSVVGYLWYRQDVEARSAFINDFYIFPAHRGRGYGKAAIKALEARLRRTGLQQLRLRVAASNGRARHVYEDGGFVVTGVNMFKDLG